MVVSSKVSPLRSIVLPLALWTSVLGNAYHYDDNSEPWVQNVRKLAETGDFMQVCNQIFVGDESVKHHSYLMSDFSREIGELCGSFELDGGCPSGGFAGLPRFLQDAFFEPIVGRIIQGSRIPFPTKSLIMMGDTGYIVSDKSLAEVDSIRNDFCVNLQGSFGAAIREESPRDNPDSGSTQTDSGSFVDPPTSTPISNPTRGPAPTLPPTSAQTVKATTGDDSTDSGMDLNAVEEGGTDSVSSSGNMLDQNPVSAPTGFPTAQQKDELSVGAIIGIAFGTLLIILIIFYFESRSRHLARQVGVLSQASQDGGNNGKSTLDDGSADVDKSAVRLASASKGKSTKSFKTKSSPLEEVKEAINNADWDNVYRVASQLAEEDDLSLSSSDLAGETIKRNHLSQEDQERTKTLDELMAKGDWTGLAVTAALYAGESGSSHNRRSKASGRGSKKERSSVGTNSSFKERMSNIQERPQEIEKNSSTYHVTSPVPPVYKSPSDDIEQGQASMEYLVGGLSAALNAGDWAQVNYFANRIKDEKGQSGASSFASGELPDTKAIVVASGSSKISLTPSNDSSDTNLSRKQTIEKLVQAQKWKGVSIMANLYEMESRQNAPVVVKGDDSKSPSLSSYAMHSTSSSRQRSSRNSTSIKELRHSDRVEENIVGFRREGSEISDSMNGHENTRTQF